MNQELQDVYNDWLIRWGVRPVTFIEAMTKELLPWINKLRHEGMLHEKFDRDQGTHVYTLQLTKEQ